MESQSFEFSASGHPLVRATHRSTIEITKDDYLTARGDCIIGIRSTAAPRDLPEELKRAIRGGAKVRVTLSAGGLEDVVTGRGSPALTLDSSRAFILRKSDFVSPETLAIGCDKSAKDLNRQLVEELRLGSPLRVKIEAEPFR